MFNKGKCILASLIALIMALCLFCSCAQTLPPLNKIDAHTDFSVNYLNVGQGDCIFIRLPDGKNALIDCGLNQEPILEKIKNYLAAYEVSKIDYFILTHPDLDHIGNAYNLIREYSVGELFIPYVKHEHLCNFTEFSNVLNLAKNKAISIKIFDSYTCIQGMDYAFAFLSPMPKGFDGSSYDELIKQDIPSDSAVNNLSPIIYFECFGKRFVFTGDAGYSQEKLVVANYTNKVYELFYNNYNINVNLECVDFLKVSHHGSADATGEQFLRLLQPKNAIISVAGQNFYGHPSSETLERLISVCPGYQLYRTDRDGTICIHKDNDNNFVVSKST